MSRFFSSFKRDEVIDSLQQDVFDLIVVGGGITGAGIALDAASRGMKTALVEMQDFAAGTSSRSSKMIHGGLRYLKNYEVKLVSQVGKERAVVYENGPHVTSPEWMVMPVYKEGEYGMFMTSVGLRVYDFLAGVKKEEKNSMLNKNEMLRMNPKLRQNGLLGGGRFVEYRSDDARLTLEVLKESARQGAVVINYTKVTDLIYEDDKVAGLVAVDQLNGQISHIRARIVVNAAGPWVDELRQIDQSLDGKRMYWTKGIHLVFDQQTFPLTHAVYFDTPDGRMVLAIPRDGKTYVGTTDTAYNGSLTNPGVTVRDRDYVLDAIRYMFPELNLQAGDVESSWAGIRPLIHEEKKRASDISRKDEIWESKSGLITIAGGKLTGYRKMAETIVDLIAAKCKQQSGKAYAPCRTKSMPVSGGHVGGSRQFDVFAKQQTDHGTALGLTKKNAYSLVKRYGSNIDLVYKLMREKGQEAQHYGLPADIYAQVYYALTDEMACTPADFFVRRTGALLFHIQWVRQWKEPVIRMMSELLGWGDHQEAHFRTELDKLLHQAVVPLEDE